MKKITLLLLMISSLANAQTISSNGQVFGYDFNKLEFSEADSVLKLMSYKEPIKSHRLVRWVGGGCSRVFYNYYFVKHQGIKQEVALYAVEGYFKLTIGSKRNGRNIGYENIVLGKTKFGELDLDFSEDDVDFGTDRRGNDYFTTPYKKIMLAAYGDFDELNSYEWKNKTIELLIWEK